MVVVVSSRLDGRHGDGAARAPGRVMIVGRVGRMMRLVVTNRVEQGCCRHGRALSVQNIPRISACGVASVSTAHGRDTVDDASRLGTGGRRRDIYAACLTHLCLAAELPTSITAPNQVAVSRTPALKRVLSLTHLMAHGFVLQCVPRFAMTKAVQRRKCDRMPGQGKGWRSGPGWRARRLGR